VGRIRIWVRIRKGSVMIWQVGSRSEKEVSDLAELLRRMHYEPDAPITLVDRIIRTLFVRFRGPIGFIILNVENCRSSSWRNWTSLFFAPLKLFLSVLRTLFSLFNSILTGFFLEFCSKIFHLIFIYNPCVVAAWSLGTKMQSTGGHGWTTPVPTITMWRNCLVQWRNRTTPSPFPLIR